MTNQAITKNEFGKVSVITLANGLEKLMIEHQTCQASVSLYGGQVLTWQPIEQKPVFWLSNEAIYQQGKAIRGGIPLCWPWFGSYEVDGKSGGNHGFARQSSWQLDDIHIVQKGVAVTISLQDEHKHPLWPYAFKLTQVLFFGTKFQQTLSMDNKFQQSIQYNGALHNYFRVSSPENIKILNLAEAEFDDKLTGKHNAASAFIPYVGPVDRIYYSDKTMKIVDKKWQRSINVATENTRQWVLWNPGKTGAKAMGDIHVNGENEYICLEAANIEWQTIDALSQVHIKQTVTIDSI